MASEIENYASMKLEKEIGQLTGSAGDDWVVMSGDALRRIHGQYFSMLGSGALVVWYSAGKAVGKTDGEKYAKKLEESGLDGLADELVKAYSNFGWGVINISKIDLEKSEVIFTMKNSPMVRGIKSREPMCWYVRGFVEGLASTILGSEASANETMCEAMKGDHCEFRVTWNFVSNR